MALQTHWFRRSRRHVPFDRYAKSHEIRVNRKQLIKLHQRLIADPAHCQLSAQWEVLSVRPRCAQLPQMRSARSSQTSATSLGASSLKATLAAFPFTALKELSDARGLHRNICQKDGAWRTANSLRLSLKCPQCRPDAGHLLRSCDCTVGSFARTVPAAPKPKGAKTMCSQQADSTCFNCMCSLAEPPLLQRHGRWGGCFVDCRSSGRFRHADWQAQAQRCPAYESCIER